MNSGVWFQSVAEKSKAEFVKKNVASKQNHRQPVLLREATIFPAQVSNKLTENQRFPHHELVWCSG